MFMLRWAPNILILLQILHTRGMREREPSQSSVRPVIRCRIANRTVGCEGDVPPGFANKKNNMASMLRTSVATLEEMSLFIPDVTLVINLASGGSFHPDELCIARSVRTMNCTMVPNPYFGDLYEWETKQLHQMNLNVPWHAKLDQAFYRGRCARHSESRFRIVDIHHRRLDVGWIKKGLTAGCLRIYTNHTERIQKHMFRSSRPFPEEHFSSYKFLVRLPGSSGASYSRHLNYLWNKGAIVLLWESEAQEWYYHALQVNTTHFLVNESNIVQTIEDCLRLPLTKQLQHVKEAQLIFQQQLTRQALALTWYGIMLARER